MRSTPPAVSKLAPLLALAWLLGGCASAGATLNSGVGDAHLEHPPYYAGASRVIVAHDTSRVGWLPATYQGGTESRLFDVSLGAGSAMGALLTDMNAYLDSALATRGVRLVERGVSAVSHAAMRDAPDVRFGCGGAVGVDDDCEARDDGAVLGRKGQRMLLAVGRPSREWISWMQEATAAQRAARTLVVTVEVGQYLLRQEGWRGDKVLELGTNHRTRLPWATSLETPVMVLQLTGAVVGRDGKAIRIGAEGMLARRTPLVASAAGAQAIIRDADVVELRAARRDDLPGSPLVWREAVRQLLDNLGLAGE